jgi:hypothetical protein
MYTYFWGLLHLDWVWYVFFSLLALAIIVKWYTRKHYRLMPIGPLCVTWVLVQGIVWIIWRVWPLTWLFWVFWLVWWVLLVAAIVNLLIGGRRDYVAGTREGKLTTVYTVTWWITRVLWWVMGLIVAATLLTWILGDWIDANIDVYYHGPSPSTSVSTPPVTTTPGSPTVPLQPTRPSTPQPCWTLRALRYCAWPMSDETPDGNVWFTVPAIADAQTNREVKHAFKHGWYPKALKWGPLMSQLDGIVTGNAVPVSELYDGGWSTRQAQLQVLAISDVLGNASYVHDGSTIAVTLPNGTTFSVSGTTGAISH